MDSMSINNNYNKTDINLVQQQQKEKSFIKVYFRKGFQGQDGVYSIKCYLDEKISDIIQKYKNESKTPDKPHEKFIFNAKALHPDSTVEKSGLCEGANIFVVETHGVRGG